MAVDSGSNSDPANSVVPVSASGQPLSGRPLQIVVAKDDHTFELDENILQSVLLRDEIKNKKVVLISVAGAFRKGKSFLLDFFLRFLNAKGAIDWLGDDSSPLVGFPWRGGADRDTTGILLWNEPFIVKTPTGEEVAVLLMDTQGSFDSESTVKDCATIFALSTMVSSVQVYNISSNLQEDDLQHLQLFTEYGRLALTNNGSKPFQSLHFLVRDWSYPYQYPYGPDGGRDLLEKRLALKETQHTELQQLRTHIRSCFSQIGCFLMPHPGLKVATSPAFDGQLNDIEGDFKDQLKAFIPSLLSPSKLVIKEINGSPITCKELVEYFKAYIKIYQGDELPEPKSMLQATAEANNLASVALAKDVYTREMEKVCGGDQPYIGAEKLHKYHTQIMEDSLKHFNDIKKMGGPEFSTKFAEKLQEDLEELYGNFQKHNDSKNIFAAARTPAVFFSFMAALYIMASVFGMLGMESVANVCNLFVVFFLLSICTWAYCRFSGEYVGVGVVIDSVADQLWEKVLGPLVEKTMHREMTKRTALTLESKKNK